MIYDSEICSIKKSTKKGWKWKKKKDNVEMFYRKNAKG